MRQDEGDRWLGTLGIACLTVLALVCLFLLSTS